MDAKTRFEKLFEKASSPKSVDCARGTIYTFPKYCKACNKGMRKPVSHDRREVQKHFKRGFCSSACLEAGPKMTGNKTVTASDSTPSHSIVDTMEEMAFASLDVQRQEQSKQNWILNLVRFADENFTLLSEKLSFLESKTGHTWYESKYYFWTGKMR